MMAEDGYSRSTASGPQLEASADHDDSRERERVT